MSDQLKKFLDDTKTYPDGTMVTIGETQVPLGSLRQLNATERQQLADGIKANSEREADLSKRQELVVDLAKKAQAAYNAAEEARVKAAGQPLPNTGADPWQDPWLAPVKGALDERDKKIATLTEQLKQAVTVVANAATTFSEDRWDKQYESIDFGKREKKPTRDEVLKFATDNKIVDRHGLPSVKLAWDKMSEADRLDEMRKTEREKGREEGRQEAIASRIPPPNVPGPGQAPLPRINTAAGDLGDLYSEAIKDPELRALIEQLPAGMA